MVHALLLFVSYWLASVAWLAHGGDVQWVWLGLLPTVWVGTLFLLLKH